MAIDTTRNATGGVVTTTERPAVPAYEGGDNSLLNYILGRRKIADERTDLEYTKDQVARNQPYNNMGPVKGRTEMPSVGASRPAQSQGSSYTPEMGQARIPKRITRYVPDPFASPYHKLATGQEAPKVHERYLDGIGWEFDGVDPRRASGGGKGEISFRDTTPSPSQQQQAPSLTYGQTQWGIVPPKRDGK